MNTSELIQPRHLQQPHIMKQPLPLLAGIKQHRIVYQKRYSPAAAKLVRNGIFIVHNFYVHASSRRASPRLRAAVNPHPGFGVMPVFPA